MYPNGFWCPVQESEGRNPDTPLINPGHGSWKPGF